MIPCCHRRVGHRRPFTQHGYQRTSWWFESSLASEVFATYLADLIVSAADRPINVLEVKNWQTVQRETNRWLVLLSANGFWLQGSKMLSVPYKNMERFVEGKKYVLCDNDEKNGAGFYYRICGRNNFASSRMYVCMCVGVREHAHALLTNTMRRGAGRRTVY